MDAINQEYFRRPETRQLAEGQLIDRISPEATKRREPKAKILTKIGSNGGIADPEKVPLLPGTMLIRFSRGPFVDRLAGGEWWLDMDANRLVERFASQQSCSIQEALSRLCAVPSEWNKMTLKAQFQTRVTLAAFKGPGKDAFYEEDSGHVRRSKVELVDGKKVSQLYIPGLNEPDLRKVALKYIGHQHMPAFE